MAVEAFDEDLAALSEVVVGEATVVQAWRCVIDDVVDGQGGVEADAAGEVDVVSSWGGVEADPARRSAVMEA
jgi:hypothetical protein